MDETSNKQQIQSTCSFIVYCCSASFENSVRRSNRSKLGGMSSFGLTTVCFDIRAKQYSGQAGRFAVYREGKEATGRFNYAGLLLRPVVYN